MIITVKLTAKGTRETLLVDDETKISDFLESNNININMTPPSLNGEPLDGNDVENTFRSLGITEDCTVSCIVKSTNA